MDRNQEQQRRQYGQENAPQKKFSIGGQQQNPGREQQQRPERKEQGYQQRNPSAPKGKEKAK